MGAASVRGWHMVEACKELGIGGTTGYRWRAERGGVPPVRSPESKHHGRYLSVLERQRIATLHGGGHGVREIARRLKRSPSTISRELRRGVADHDVGGYDGDLAHARARERARRTRHSKLVEDPELAEMVGDKLDQEWSPEQICGWLRRALVGRPEWHLCHETIYQALYHGDRGLKRDPHNQAANRRPLRKRRRHPDRRQPRFVAPATLVDCRPPVMEQLSPGTGRGTSSSGEPTSPPSAPWSSGPACMSGWSISPTVEPRAR